MKSELLRILREAGDECVSGQSLCERFGVSRQAVWKNITQLKEKGFEIKAELENADKDTRESLLELCKKDTRKGVLKLVEKYEKQKAAMP